MYESKLLSKTKWLLIPLMLILMVVSMLGMITPAKAAETNADTNVNLRDQVTENYIKEHIDSKYTSVDKTELKNLILVKQTLFDGNKLKENENLDIMYKPFDNFDKFLGQFMSNVPVYNLSDNSDYYVAYINTMQNNSQATIRDYDFAKDNNNGELVEGCIFDQNTGLAYIPKTLFASEQESGKEQYIPLQVQIMQVIGGNTEDISLKTCSATEDNQNVTSTNEIFSGLYDTEVSSTVEKNLDPEHIAVFVNGVIVPANTYRYDPENGVITVFGSPASVNTITVEKTNDAEKNVTDQIFEDVNLKTQDDSSYTVYPNPVDYNTLPNTTSNAVKIPKNAQVGDYIDGSATLYYKGIILDPIKWNDLHYDDTIDNTDPEITQSIMNMYNNSTLHAVFDVTNGNQKFMKWVNDGTPFTEEHDHRKDKFTQFESIDKLAHSTAVFYTDFADGKSSFKFANGANFDASPFEQLNLTCVHVENPADTLSNINNGEIYTGDSKAKKYESYPMRMRIFRLTDNYAVIGIVAARCHTILGGIPDLEAGTWGQDSSQASYGLVKVPIQRVNLNLSIEKNDESGAKLAGADMQLYKDKVEGKPYAFWNTSEDDGNPKDFEDIEAGKYILVEENAPTGYTKIEPIEFTLNDDNTVTITKDPSGKATVVQGEGTATIKVEDPKESKPVGDKTETDPGNGKDVEIGQEITYQITTTNKYTENADIVITDPLDTGLDFVTADNGGRYNENTRTVTWSFDNVAPNETVTVTFKAKVNETAEIKVVNDAKIIYNNDYEIKTRKVENPIPEPPDPTGNKTETDPGDGQPVKHGQEITYEITTTNSYNKTANIVITDPLDKGLDFVTADNGGNYNQNTREITWSFNNVKPKETVKVTFKAKVNETAEIKVVNDAKIVYNNNYEIKTRKVENPIPEPPVKAEPTPGENKTVSVGGNVTYEVTQKNYKDAPADIVFTDHLDSRVDFVTADNDGHYDANTHTITWTIKNVPSGQIAKVGFTVKVNEKAKTIIENQAIAKVGNDPEQETNIIKNPLDEPPVKTEPTPGENKTVKVGDEVKYEVSQRNYRFEAADIVITDHLDKGVDFISADNNGQYDSATHTITWTIKNVASDSTAKVGFTVKVNEKAQTLIENQAIAKVGDDPEKETNIIRNPIPEPPVKAEPTPGENKTVNVGDEVTYEVSQKNYQFEAADIVITDHLDEAVDFVTADNNGSYDEGTHTITWTIPNVPAGETAKVGFVVKVNDKAVEKIENQAITKVGNDDEQETNIIKNPLPEPPVKTEPKPGENEPVAVGDEVTYEVSQKNYKLENADIVITDHLDERVDFVSADNDGKYDEGTHTITWTIKDVPAGETAKVGFVVKVNDKATEIIENQAIAKVGDDPEQETNIIKNPIKIPPVKTEITPGEGKQVKIGDEVTYKVHFMNYRLTPETVVVTDRLDPGVDFVSADNNGTYDKANHMIVWTFKDMEARKEQDVTFKVKVNSKAGTVIRNQAEVQVGNDPVQKTNIIENPLAPESAKTGVNGNNNLFNIAVISVIGIAILGCGVYFINRKQRKDTAKEKDVK